MAESDEIIRLLELVYLLGLDTWIPAIQLDIVHRSAEAIACSCSTELQYRIIRELAQI